MTATNIIDLDNIKEQSHEEICLLADGRTGRAGDCQ